MSTTKESSKSFLTSASTRWITLVRLGLIVQTFFDSSIHSIEWIYNQSFLSILVRPHQCLSHLEEAHAIWTLATPKLSKDFSSYYLANNSIRIPPIMLAIFSPLVDIGSNSRLWFPILLLAIDIIISYLIEQIGIRLLDLTSSTQSSSDRSISSQTIRLPAEGQLQQQLPQSIQPKYAHIFPTFAMGHGPSDPTRTSREEFSKKEADTIRGSDSVISLKSLPLLSAQFYFWSPFTVLPSSLFYCWQNIPSLFLAASIYESIRSSSSRGSLLISSAYLSVATYLEPHHIAYVAPVTILSSIDVYNSPFLPSTMREKWSSKKLKSAVFFIIFYAVWSSLLQGMSYNLVGSENYWKVFSDTYGNSWLTTTPNLSLQWYFRMQIFSRFRDYFGAICTGIPFLITGPLYLRFFKYPTILVACIAMIWTIYRPVQVLYDANFALCFFLFCPQSLARMGYAAFISFCCLPVPVLLNIVDHWMWLDANNGNANYMFFQCLAYNVFLGIILGQFTSASMRHDKALRLAHKLSSKSGDLKGGMESLTCTEKVIIS